MTKHRFLLKRVLKTSLQTKQSTFVYCCNDRQDVPGWFLFGPVFGAKIGLNWKLMKRQLTCEHGLCY